ncbi:serine/threonine-protein kinase 3 [Chytriomyces cf. hyalinus JEL632]|nr:serine/threonine-protein kinase 3 [Chytriomyces cf. hyalinus JEL632]
MGLLSDAELGMDPTQVLTLQTKLGEGSYGTVHKALHARSGTTVAVKILPVGGADITQSIKEISFMTGIQSPFVVEYHGSYLRDTELWIVMEYCGAGSISDLMETCNMTLSEDQISVVCRYVLKGLAYMHSLRKIHRDIKAGNILINTKGESKLADFGVSGQLSEATMKRQTVIGTPFWMAPEVIQEVGYGTQADIWSLGITCIEMADGRPPYADIHPMRAIFMIPSKPPPHLEDEERYSKVFRQFVARCLTKDPKLRPGAEELLNDPFVKRNPSTDAFSSMLATALQPRRDSAAHSLPDADYESEDDMPAEDLPGDADTADTILRTAKDRENMDDVFMAEEEYSIYGDNSEYVDMSQSNAGSRYTSRPGSPESDLPSRGTTPIPNDKSKLRDYGVDLVTKAMEYFSPSAPPLPVTATQQSLSSQQQASASYASPSPVQQQPLTSSSPVALSSILKSSSRPASPGAGIRARKKSVTDERMLASLEDRKEAEIAAVVAQFKQRKAAILDAIFMKGGSV